MKSLRSWLITAIAVAGLAACGGGDPYVPGSDGPAGAPTAKGAFGAVVSFGDSLSDLGSYKPATSLAGNGTPPFFGGKFTTNSTTEAVSPGDAAPLWVESVAGALGIVVTQAEIGFAGSSVKCPAAAVPALASSCTAYGQGGARVTDPDGIGKAGGALTVPVKTQIANHLATFGGLGADDLVLVWAGANDALVQFGSFAATAAQIQAQAASGALSADQANALLLEAQLQALGAMKQAALELGGYIRSDILGKGARYVAVLNLPDIAATPFGRSVPASAQPVLTALSENFNLWLREALAGQPVQLLDMFAFYRELLATPAAFGFVDITTPVCSAAAIAALTGGAVADGSSLFCNATPGAPYNTLAAGADIDTWLFADGVHPTRGGHAAIAAQVMAQLRAFGWID
ncbi:MAG: SGNH/GDSL hydrolase family protein [Burkholderiales bacterium]|nr:SGNH/GDSL hydrolase family protein [Burkholderiales bacterium]